MGDDWREEYLLYSRLPVFKRRVLRAKGIIAKALATPDVSWYLSSSFGKDSICMLDLVLEQRPKIPVLHIDSNYCLPELYDTRNWYVRNRDIDLRIRHAEDYMALMRDFGLPHITRTENQQNRVVDRLKKSSSEQWAEERGFSGVFLGLRKEESQGRQISLAIRSPIYQVKSGMWKCCPLASWTGKDVWAYIVSRGLPYPKFYDFTALGDTREWIRSASWVTTDGAGKGRLVWLRYYYPGLYSKLIREFPEVARYA